MADVEYEVQSFGINVQFPSIFEPEQPRFNNRAMYGVVFTHFELPTPTRYFIRPFGEHGRVAAKSLFAPPIVEMSGQENRLQRLLEQAESSRVKHRLLTGQQISVTVQPYVVRHPLARVPVALSLRAVGLYVTNLETRYEQLMEELREELKGR